MASFLIRLQRLIYRNRSLTFTPTGTRFLLLTLAIGAAAVNTGNNLLYLILGMMLSLIIVSGILSEQSLRGLSVEWRFPARIFARQPAPIEMRIRNGNRFLPSYSFRVDGGSDPARSTYTFKLPAGETITASQWTRFEKRGRQPLFPCTLRTAFPFGFFNKSLIRPTLQTVLVYPRILPMPPGLRAAGAGGNREDRRRGFGAELYNLRDYTWADDARGIHWKASARESRLLVKEHEREEEMRVHLVLSNRLPGKTSEALLENFERAVMLTASLTQAYLRRGCPVSLKSLSGEVAEDPDAILKALALIQALPLANEAAADGHRTKIAALMKDPRRGRRVLILPCSDPLWETARGGFSEVFTADEPRVLEWAETKARAGGVRP